MTQWRHTLDLRVSQADAAVSPVFSSSRLSQYFFGTRGDESGFISTLQQLQIDPPNLRLFQQGSVPFIGDYIDVAGPDVPPSSGPWPPLALQQPAGLFSRLSRLLDVESGRSPAARRRLDALHADREARAA